MIALVTELAHVVRATQQWQRRATGLSLEAREVSLMPAAFDTPDLALARHLTE